MATKAELEKQVQEQGLPVPEGAKKADLEELLEEPSGVAPMPDGEEHPDVVDGKIVAPDGHVIRDDEAQPRVPPTAQEE